MGPELMHEHGLRRSRRDPERPLAALPREQEGRAPAGAGAICDARSQRSGRSWWVDCQARSPPSTASSASGARRERRSAKTAASAASGTR